MSKPDQMNAVRQEIMKVKGVSEKDQLDMIMQECYPVCLADLIRLMNHLRVDLHVTTSFELPEQACVIPPPGIQSAPSYPEPGYAYWNLNADDIRDQSRETVRFFYELLR
jgi:hypothetical protein